MTPSTYEVYERAQAVFRADPSTDTAMAYIVAAEFYMGPRQGWTLIGDEVVAWYAEDLANANPSLFARLTQGG